VKDLAATERELRARDLPFRSVRVPNLEEATRSAREALVGGERFLVAAGGDDLVNAVVNGMLHEGESVADGAVLGVVAGTAPCDFIRTFGLPPEPERACRYLEGEGTMTIDAVRVRFLTRRGSSTQRCFVNMAQAGLGGAVAARTSGLPPVLGRLRRFVGFWLAAATFRAADVELRGDRGVWKGSVHDVMVANCQYAGDGYRLSPKSWPADGYLDVLVMTGPKSDSFTILPKAVLGEHLPHPNIVEYRARTLSIESARRLPLQADGQPLGTTPASFEVLPGAIRLKI
jgi:diacylglycerol kinase family enzyme